jgi:hypothetical protein
MLKGWSTTATTATNNRLQDAFASSVYISNEKEQQILQLENKLYFVYSELSHDFSHDKGLEEEKCKYKQILYTILVYDTLDVAQIIIPSVWLCSTEINSHTFL